MAEISTAEEGAQRGAGRSWLVPSPFALAVSIVLVATAFAILPRADDIFWHLAAGELILDSGQIPATNTFSFTAPDHPWVAHSWGSEALFAAVYRALGPAGLALVAAFAAAAAAALVFLLFDGRARAPMLAGALTLVVAFVGLANHALRPYLFGNILLLCVLCSAEAPRFGGRLRLPAMALLFAAWACLHGSFPVGWLVLAVFVVSDRRGRGRRAGDLAAAVVGSALTPLHVRGLSLPVEYVRQILGGEGFLSPIREWQPPWTDPSVGGVAAAFLLLVIVSVAASGRRPRAPSVALCLLGVAAASVALRNVPLLAFLSVPLLARHLPAALERLAAAFGRRPVGRTSDLLGPGRGGSPTSAWALPAATAVFVAATATVPQGSPIGWSALTGVARLGDLSPAFHPTELVRALSERRSEERLLVYFDWAGAVIWHRFPESRVFIDQRNDCYPPEVLRDYLSVHRVEPGYEERLDRWSVDAVAYPSDSTLARDLEARPDWTTAFTAGGTSLLVRAGRGPRAVAGAPSDRHEDSDATRDLR